MIFFCPAREPHSALAYDTSIRSKKIMQTLRRNPFTASPGRRGRLSPVVLVEVLVSVAALLVGSLLFLLPPLRSHAVTDNTDCTLIVPAHPLTVRGLATSYQLTATNPANGPCHESNTHQSAFVQGVIYDPATGTFSVYNPLVIDAGTQPAVLPRTPRLPRGAIVGIWFGFNANTLLLQGAQSNTLAQAHCVNGLGQSLFTHFAYCNAPAFFAAVKRGVRAHRVHIPPLQTARDGQPCPTVRDFSVVDQDQSGNVQTQYLATANGQTAQFSAANHALLQNATTIATASDNRLLPDFIDPALGCQAWQAPNLADNKSLVPALALDEVQAAADQQPPIALVPLTDPMTTVATTLSLAKTNLYRRGVDQIAAANDQQASGTTFCQNLVQTGMRRLELDQPLTIKAPTPDASTANNLFTFLVHRFHASYNMLNCPQLLNMPNPVTTQTNPNGVVISATFNRQATSTPVPTTSATPIPSPSATVAEQATSTPVPTTTVSSQTLPPPSSDWSTYLHDPLRGAANQIETTLSPSNAGRLTKLWSFKTGGVIAASPTVVGNTIYVGSWDGYEYAIDATTGQQKWKRNVGQSYYPNCGGFQQHMGVTSTATVANGVVYVAGGDANFYALDANSGVVLWKVFLGDPARGYYNFSSPLLYNGNIYYGTASNCDNPLVQGQLFQISLTSHTITNTFNVVPNGQTGGGVWTSPSVDPTTNTIYLTTGNGSSYSFSIIALDAATFTVKGSWKVPVSQQITDSDWGTTPTLFTTPSGIHLVAVNNKNGNIYIFRADNLQAGPLWQKSLAVGGECPECGQGSISSDTFANGTLYAAGGNTTIHGTVYKGAVRAFDPATGNTVWEHGTTGPVFAALSSANNLIVDSAGATLEVLNASNGTVLYHFQTGGVIYGAPSIANGKIFVGSTDTNIYAFAL